MPLKVTVLLALIIVSSGYFQTAFGKTYPGLKLYECHSETCILLQVFINSILILPIWKLSLNFNINIKYGVTGSLERSSKLCTVGVVYEKLLLYKWI